MTSTNESSSPDTLSGESLNLSPVDSKEESSIGGISFSAPTPSPPLTEVDIESPNFTVRIKSPAPLDEVAGQAEKLFSNHLNTLPSGGRAGFRLDPAA